MLFLGTLRVIAGEYADVQGPAKTWSPIHIYDINIHALTELSLVDGN